MATPRKSDDPGTDDLNELNARIAEAGAAATTAEARNKARDAAGLTNVTTSDVS